MPEPDLYELLGVSEDASQEEIKSAYREKAQNLHPDVSDDPNAEEKFKKINKAFEILSDPQKRRQYDQFGTTGRSAGGGGGRGGFGGAAGAQFGGLEDIFEFFFGEGGGGDPFSGRGRGRGRGRQQQRSRGRDGEDLKDSVTLDLEDVLEDRRESVTVSHLVECSQCGGSGAAEGSEPVTCDTCGGQGRVKRTQRTMLGTVQQVTTCPDCEGRGQVVDDPCSECRGQKRVRHQDEVEFRIPAGVRTGDIIRVRGEGNAGMNGGRDGDLLIEVRVRPHDLFRRDGADLRIDVYAGFLELVRGNTITVPTPRGERDLEIPPGTQSHETLKLPGEGLPELEGQGAGDFYVTVKVYIPEDVPAELEETLAGLSDEDLLTEGPSTGLFGGQPDTLPWQKLLEGWRDQRD